MPERVNGHHQFAEAIPILPMLYAIVAAFDDVKSYRVEVKGVTREASLWAISGSFKALVALDESRVFLVIKLLVDLFDQVRLQR